MTEFENDHNMRIKFMLNESERAYFSELCERIGLRPANLARKIICDFMRKEGFNDDLNLKEDTDAVKIYFKLGSEYGSLFDSLCWQEQTRRNLMARQIIVDRIKAFKKDEIQKRRRTKKMAKS